MRKLLYPISVTFLSFSLTATPFLQAGVKPEQAVSEERPLPHYSFHDIKPAELSVAEKAAILYDEMELGKYGLNKQAFELAYTGYENLLSKNKLSNTDFLTICDFSQSSRKKRLYIIDMEKNELFINTYVAHGRNSGKEYATSFSNKPTSLQSSLGFYITKETYYGGHGLALKLHGVESGINNNAYNRKIVLHGSEYVGQKYLKRSKMMGRSFGCPAVPQAECKKIINNIKKGSCLFIYHPTKKYLESSKILNG